MLTYRLFIGKFNMGCCSILPYSAIQIWGESRYISIQCLWAGLNTSGATSFGQFWEKAYGPSGVTVQQRCQVSLEGIVSGTWHHRTWLGNIQWVSIATPICLQVPGVLSAWSFMGQSVVSIAWIERFPARIEALRGQVLLMPQPPHRYQGPLPNIWPQDNTLGCWTWVKWFWLILDVSGRCMACVTSRIQVGIGMIGMDAQMNRSPTKRDSNIDSIDHIDIDNYKVVTLESLDCISVFVEFDW